MDDQDNPWDRLIGRMDYERGLRAAKFRWQVAMAVGFIAGVAFEGLFIYFMIWRV